MDQNLMPGEIPGPPGLHRFDFHVVWTPDEIVRLNAAFGDRTDDSSPPHDEEE